MTTRWTTFVKHVLDGSGRLKGSCMLEGRKAYFWFNPASLASALIAYAAHQWPRQVGLWISSVRKGYALQHTRRVVLPYLWFPFIQWNHMLCVSESCIHTSASSYELFVDLWTPSHSCQILYSTDKTLLNCNSWSNLILKDRHRFIRGHRLFPLRSVSRGVWAVLVPDSSFWLRMTDSKSSAVVRGVGQVMKG